MTLVLLILLMADMFFYAVTYIYLIKSIYQIKREVDEKINSLESKIGDQ